MTEENELPKTNYTWNEIQTDISQGTHKHRDHLAVIEIKHQSLSRIIPT